MEWRMHTVQHCTQSPVAPELELHFPIVARPRVCLSTLLWSFSNIGWDKAVKTAEVIAATLQPSSPRKTSLRGSVAGTAGDNISCLEWFYKHIQDTRYDL